MGRFIRGVVLAELFALWVEFFYKFGFKLNPKFFIVAIPFYFIFISILHVIFSRLEGIRFHRLVCFIGGGLVGLVLLEWGLVGNSPWKNPKAFQSGMFLFHAVYPILGYLLVRVPGYDRTGLKRYMLVASLVVALAWLFSNQDIRKLWFLFMPLVGYIGLCYFVIKLSRLPVELSAESSNERPAE